MGNKELKIGEENLIADVVTDALNGLVATKKVSYRTADKKLHYKSVPNWEERVDSYKFLFSEKLKRKTIMIYTGLDPVYLVRKKYGSLKPVKEIMKYMRGTRR